MSDSQKAKSDMTCVPSECVPSEQAAAGQKCVARVTANARTEGLAFIDYVSETAAAAAVVGADGRGRGRSNLHIKCHAEGRLVSLSAHSPAKKSNKGGLEQGAYPPARADCLKSLPKKFPSSSIDSHLLYKVIKGGGEGSGWEDSNFNFFFTASFAYTRTTWRVLGACADGTQPTQAI